MKQSDIMSFTTQSQECTFELLSSDNLFLVLQFLGQNSYSTFGSANKKCNEVFKVFELPKKSFIGLLPEVSIKKLLLKRSSISCFDRAIAKAYIIYDSSILHNILGCDLRISMEICYLAAAKGRIDILDRFCNNSYYRVKRIEDSLKGDIKICMHAARSGELHTLKWLVSKNFKIDKETVWEVAAENGRIIVLEWMRNDGYEWNEETYAKTSNLNTLEWLKSNGCPLNERCCIEAADRCNLDALKWLHTNDCPWNSMTLYCAAQQGYMEMCKWLLANNCPVDSDVCSGAAFSGNLGLLKFLHSNGCPLESNSSYEAQIGDHLHILKWLHSQGCPLGGIYGAAENRDFTMMVWLREHGCPWEDGGEEGEGDYYGWANLVCSGDLNLIKWAINDGCPWNKDGCYRAIDAYSGNFEVLEYLHNNLCPFDTETFTDEVIRTYSDLEGRRTELLRWIEANGVDND